MIAIDKNPTGQQIRQFASQASYIHPELIKHMVFEGDKSDEFYKGLLCGLCVAYSFQQGGGGNFIGQVIAFIADQMEKKEIIG